jgi:quercetin dioxygenase-like cupin family protein
MGARAQAVATIKIDEPYVRVTEYRFAPGAETGWHRHQHDYVVVPLLDGQLTARTARRQLPHRRATDPPTVRARRGRRAQRHQ